MCCKDDCGWITQLKQQISKRRYSLPAHRSVLNVLTLLSFDSLPPIFYRVQSFSNLAMFSFDFFCILYAKCLPYFYFRFVWPTDLESIPHTSTTMAIITTKFEVDMIIDCRVKVFCLVIRYVILWPWRLVWPFDLEQLPYVASHVSNPATKFDDPMPIRSWVISQTSFIGYQWHCVFGYCAYVRITWDAHRGKILHTYLESTIPICLFTMQLWWLYDKVK